MSLKAYFLYFFVMALVTYLIRAVPFAACRGQIKNKFFRSFLAYVPYTVLSAMTFPAILTATGSLISAIVGFGVAVVLAYLDRGLIRVALWASAAVLAVDLITGLF